MNTLIREIDSLIAVLEHKSFYQTEEAKEEHWKRHVASAEAYEKPIIAVMPDVWKQARREALHAVRDGKPAHVDRLAIHKAYKEKVTPILHECLATAIENGSNLVKPKNPHKDLPPIPPNFSMVAVEWLRTRVSWAATQIGETLADDLAQSLAAGYAQGESIADLTTRVMEFFDNPARAERIARTETIAASSQGALYGYQEAGLEQCEFYTANDERTCIYCDEYNGQVFNLGDEMPIPLHPDCRCVYLPVIK